MSNWSKRATIKLFLGIVLMLVAAIGGGFAVILKVGEGKPPAVIFPPEAVTQYSPLHYARLDVAWTFGKAGIDRCREYIEPLARQAARWGIDGKILASIAVKESRCEPLAISPKKAAGVMQVHLPYWQCSPGRKSKCWDFTRPENNPFTPERNIELAAEILADLFKQYNEHEALRRYNGNAGRGEQVHRYADSVVAGAQ